jgi:hypothetical protein
LPALVGSDTGEGEEVDHLELSGDPATPLWERRPPATLPEIGIPVELQQPDEDLADDAAADRPQGSLFGRSPGWCCPGP